MPNKNNFLQPINNIFTKIKANPRFQKLLSLLNNLSSKLNFKNNPQVKKIFMFTVIAIVLIIGLNLGQKLALKLKSSPQLPIPTIQDATPTPTPYSENFNPIKQAIQNFNPQLPDPIIPTFDDKISLQELED